MCARVLLVPAFVAVGLVSAGSAADSRPQAADADKAKKALQELQDFIGQWNLEGLQKDGPRTTAWKEKVTWGWKFQGGDAWLTVEFTPAKGSGSPKVFTAGTLKYDPARKKYVLSLTGVDKKERVFEGEIGRQGGLVLSRKDASTGDVYRLTLYTLAEGVRFQLKLERQEGGKGPYEDVFVMNGGKEGESFAAGAGKRKAECIVSGGAATIPVSIGGRTYYVCCSGCRDELLANPDKYLRAKK